MPVSFAKSQRVRRCFFLKIGKTVSKVEEFEQKKLLSLYFFHNLGVKDWFYDVTDIFPVVNPLTLEIWFQAQPKAGCSPINQAGLTFTCLTWSFFVSQLRGTLPDRPTNQPKPQVPATKTRRRP